MKPIRLEDDFYSYVNNKWLEETKIPSDKPLIASFIELIITNEEKLMRDLKEFSEKGVDPKVYKDELFNQFISIYRQALNKEKRNQEGNGFILDFINQIKKIKSFRSLEKISIDLGNYGLPNLFEFGVQADMKNSNFNALYFGSPGLQLPEKSYYNENSPTYQTGLYLLNEKKKNSIALLKKIGVRGGAKIVEEAFEFDKLLVDSAKTSEEESEYLKSYNPYKASEFVGLSKLVNLKKLIKAFIPNKRVNQIIVTNPKFFEAIDSLLEDNLQLIKSWLILCVSRNLASKYATDDVRLLADKYSLLLTGQQKPIDFDKFTYGLLSSSFYDVLGLYFGNKYFGEDAKNEVEGMVKEFVEIYKERLQKNKWLSKSTIKKAISKLSKIEAVIGYPQNISPVYSKYVPNPEYSYAKNMLELQKTKTDYNFFEFGLAPDKSLWLMGAHDVNAYYHPTNNQIVFPAGILQPPFYSYTQSKGENYGGIGSVIAHEITHAFDTNGAQIDENGNINNWWKESDFKAFNDKAEDMIKLFDGLDIPNVDAKCNGKLTVTENIADAAGLSCAFQAGSKHKEFKLDDFFKGWAQVWRFKSSKEFTELLVNIDVHAPSYLRGQMQLKNFPLFAKHYNIKETDGMYLNPNSRVSIW